MDLKNRIGEDLTTRIDNAFAKAARSGEELAQALIGIDFETRTRVNKIVAVIQRVPVEEIQSNTLLPEESLDFITFCMAMEDEFGVELSDNDWSTIKTVRDAWLVAAYGRITQTPVSRETPIGAYRSRLNGDDESRIAQIVANVYDLHLTEEELFEFLIPHDRAQLRRLTYEINKEYPIEGFTVKERNLLFGRPVWGLLVFVKDHLRPDFREHAPRKARTESVRPQLARSDWQSFPWVGRRR